MSYSKRFFQEALKEKPKEKPVMKLMLTEEEKMLIKQFKYKTFICEWETLENLLNQLDPDCKGYVFHVGHFGSSVRVVMKL